MISAIILARVNSSRLNKKHLLKIGKYSLLENIYYKLIKNKNISQVYIATGSKKKNLIYEKFIKKKKLKIKIFNYKKENNVTERIYELTKKIKTKYSIIISGDCPAIDNSFINRAFYKLQKDNADFITTRKKTLHEGIILFKNKAWLKVNKFSKSNYSQENPSYTLFSKKKFFNFTHLNSLKKDVGKELRLSIDTYSDFQFFKLVSHHSKKKLINFDDVIKFRNFSIINEDVKQKKVKEKNKKKIFIITSSNKKIGYGHLTRSKTIFRQVKETYSTDVKYVFYKTKVDTNIKEFIKDEKYLIFKNVFRYFSKNDVFFIDVPFSYFLELANILKHFKTIVIDNYSKFNKHINVIPSLTKPSKIKKQKILSGKKYLIISKDLLYEKLKNCKKKIDFLFLFGASKFPDEKLLNDIKNSKIKNYLIILGPYVQKSKINELKTKKIKFIVNPKNYFQLLCLSKKIISVLGVSSYEIMGIGLKPIIYTPANETTNRKLDISYLTKKKIIQPYYYNILKSKKILTLVDKDISFGAKNIVKLI